MVRKQPQELLTRRQLKVRKIKPWRNRAAAQGPARSERDGRLPSPRGDHVLRPLSAREVPTEHERLMHAAFEDVKLHRIAIVVVPDFIRPHTMNGREGPRRKQEVDRGRGGARSSVRQTAKHDGRAPRLPIEASLGMWRKPQLRNDALRVRIERWRGA